jgi:glycosyltransferase involved in cell wall biosynthesis
LSSSATRAPSARVIPELRSVHIERYFNGVPADLFYFKRNFDLGGREVPRQIERMRTLSLLRRLWKHDGLTLEVPEPLWMREMPRTLLMAATWKLSGARRGRPRRVVAYCMENNDLATLLGGDRSLPGPVVTLARQILRFVVRGLVDDLAFASQTAMDRYESILGRHHRVNLRLFPELPAAKPTPSTSDGRSAVFVGALEARKGLPELMRAWTRVEARLPDAALNIYGGGVLEGAVRAWCAERPDQRRFHGLVERDITVSEIARNVALVAPSVPEGRWREQIGLPIKEALAAGLTVVTTDQTGLAAWLSAGGHHVVQIGENDAMTSALADEIVEALTRPLDRTAVRASLPASDSRLRAEAWLHSRGHQEPGRPRAVILNPLGGTLAHYTSALESNLSDGGVDVSVFSVLEPSAGGGKKVRWLQAYVASITRARRALRAHGDRSGASVIVTWPVLGWFDLVLLRGFLPGRVRSALIVHDPVPLVHAVGYSRLAAAVGSWLTPGVTPVVHSAAAQRDLPEGRIKSSSELLPHPIKDMPPRATPDGVPLDDRPLIRVLGQFKPDRDIDIMTALARHDDLSDCTFEVVGRKWPPIPGWSVEDRFVTEDELDALIDSSDVVLIPYSRFYQSGIAIRALELGTPVVGPRDSSLEALLVGGGDMLVPAGPSDVALRADQWRRAIRAALSCAPTTITSMQDKAKDQSRTAWSGWLREGFEKP